MQGCWLDKQSNLLLLVPEKPLQCRYILVTTRDEFREATARVYSIVHGSFWQDTPVPKHCVFCVDISADGSLVSRSQKLGRRKE